MRIQPVVATVVGIVDETHWGQVLLLPHAYGVVEVELPSGGALAHGITLLSKLTKLLSQPPTSLAAAQTIANTISQGGGIASLILLVPAGDVVYLVVAGQGTVYLKRGSELAILMESSGSISGEVRTGDTLLLAGSGLTRSVSKEKFAAVFDHESPSQVAEKVTMFLHEAGGSAGSAGLIFQVEKLIPMEEERIEDLVEAEVETSAVAQPVISSRRPFGLAQGRPFLSKVRSFRPHHLSRARAIVRSRLIRRGRFSKRFIAAALVLLLFVGSIVVGLSKKAGNTNTATMVAATTNAQHAYDEGMALLTLNTVKGRERLEEAKALLEPFAKTAPRSKEGKTLLALYEQISQSIIQSLAVTKSEPQLFYDVSLLKKGAAASGMTVTDGTLALLDAAGRTVYAVTLSSKNGQVIAGGDVFEGSSHVATAGDTVYVLANGGISAINVGEKKTKSVVKNDSEWGNIAGLAAFGGNLYLLDSGKNRIWKYVATESGFTDRREYLNPDTLPDFSKITSMAIDGSVWAATSDSRILRFTQGKETTFAPQGVTPAFGSTLQVATSDETDHLYVLDAGNKRVVVLDKDGVYVAQYVWEGALVPTKIAVSGTAKKILLLVDGKIYAIEIK